MDEISGSQSCTAKVRSKTFFNIEIFLIISKNWKKYNLIIQSLITMGMRCFCAQAQKQVDKCEIYLAISSFNLLLWE